MSNIYEKKKSLCLQAYLEEEEESQKRSIY